MALSSTEKKNLAREIEQRKIWETLEIERLRTNNRTKFQNFQRCMTQQQKDQENDDERRQNKIKAMAQEEGIKAQERLAQELNKMKQEEMFDLRRRQILRKFEPELQELESRLQAAYVQKGVAIQLAEREVQKLQEQIKKKEEKDMMLAALMKDEEWREQVKREDILQKHKYKQELQDQMIYKEKLKRSEYEEFLRDKKLRDDYIERMNDEFERGIQEARCKQQKLREEMVKFAESRECWKQKKRLELLEEHKKIEEYLLSKTSDAKEKREAKERKEAAKSRIVEDIGKNVYQTELRKRERQELIQQLGEQHLKEKEEERHKQDEAKVERQKIDTRICLLRQMKEHEERAKKEEELDAFYRKQMLQKLAEQDRVEQMTAERKKRRMIEIKQEVELAMQERRQKRAEELQALVKLQEEERKVEEEKKRLVEHEKREMLKEHAQYLMGFIPSHVIHPNELCKLACEMAEENNTVVLD